VTAGTRFLWVAAHLGGIAVGIWGGIQFVHWAL
jgi:hypothetical protein